jgi:hypothetical protein
MHNAQPFKEEIFKGAPRKGLLLKAQRNCEMQKEQLIIAF